MSKVVKMSAILISCCTFTYGCGVGGGENAKSLVTPLEYIETPTSPKYDRLRATLETFIGKVSTGEDFAAMYLGDRLLVLSDNVYNEVLAAENNGYYVPLTYGCGNTCGLTLRELVELLKSHLVSPDTRRAQAPTASVRAWPSMIIVNKETTWKISFGMRGDTIVSVEVFGPISGTHPASL